jgi:hypothetical protein
MLRMERWVPQTLVLLFYAALALPAAASAGWGANRCDRALPQRLSSRLPLAPSGSDFARRVASMSEDDREQAIETELLAGNMPAFLRRLVPVALSGRTPDGRSVEVTVCVLPDYRFDLAQGVSPEGAVSRMAAAHNRAHEADKSWSYGPAYERGICAAGSQKSPGCQGGGWSQCGSNTYPAGDFPACHSALGVYDLNGNAAEHMNLPLNERQMASRGSKELGYTEMKGSWFIFDTYHAHQDWCRWRAPYWHGSRVMDPHSHSNYHLGFRCCKSL